MKNSKPWWVLPLCLLAIFYHFSTVALAQKPPALTLANSYRLGMGLNFEDYWLSEKYDGIRAFWDGSTLWTRAGFRIHTPTWFTENWPKFPMEGELWAGRGKFSTVSSTVRQDAPKDEAWHAIIFMVFDLPQHPGTFAQRFAALQKTIPNLRQAWVGVAEHKPIASEKALLRMLNEIVANHGEGLILRRKSAVYRAGRSNDFLKVKLHEDAEAKIIAHLPGRGKYNKNTVGALLLQTPAGKKFRVGSGLNDALRNNPPPLGAVVTYRYRGLTEEGLPRFPTFLRVREEKFSPHDP